MHWGEAHRTRRVAALERLTIAVVIAPCGDRSCEESVRAAAPAARRGEVLAAAIAVQRGMAHDVGVGRNASVEWFAEPQTEIEETLGENMRMLDGRLHNASRIRNRRNEGPCGQNMGRRMRGCISPRTLKRASLCSSPGGLPSFWVVALVFDIGVLDGAGEENTNMTDTRQKHTVTLSKSVWLCLCLCSRFDALEPCIEPSVCLGVFVFRHVRCALLPQCLRTPLSVCIRACQHPFGLAFSAQAAVFVFSFFDPRLAPRSQSNVSEYF